MKRRIQIALLVSTVLLAFGGAALLADDPQGQSQPMATHDHNAMMKNESMMDDDSMMNCKAMGEKHQEMQKHMAAMDAKLAALVDEMNRAEGSAKVDKVAVVVNELVSQRNSMRDGMMAMQPMMMKHMMQHMQGGMMEGMSEGMSSCPMMNAMKGDKPEDHSQHH